MLAALAFILILFAAFFVGYQFAKKELYSDYPSVHAGNTEPQVEKGSAPPAENANGGTVQVLQENLEMERRAREMAESEVKLLRERLDERILIDENISSRDSNWLASAKVQEESFEPSPELKELFALSDAQMGQLKTLGQGTIDALKRWENQSAIVVSEENIEEHRDVFPSHRTRNDSDQVVRYTIPAAPEELLQDYSRKLSDIVGEAKAAAIERQSPRALENLTLKRTVEVAISERGNGGVSQRLRIGRFLPDGKSVSSHHYGSMRNELEIRERWQHLFEVKEVD